MDGMGEPDRAHLRSQSGPGSGATFTAIPTSSLTPINAQPFRVLLQCRFRLNLPFVARTCRCCLILDSKGNRQAACATAGVPSRRIFALEAAVAKMCREAEARVVCDALVRDLSLGVLGPGDGRRVEIVANNSPLFGDAQLAVDAELVCVLRRDGRAQPGAGDVDGRALKNSRRRKARVFP